MQSGMRFITRLLAVTCVMASMSTQASMIYVTPANSSTSLTTGAATLNLFMNFDEATLGGGIDLSIDGPAALLGFTPTAYFNSLDPFFTGYSTDSSIADGDLAIWLGDFAGLSGSHELGSLQLSLLALGTVNISVDINSLFGAFQSAETFLPQEATLIGATLQVIDVPTDAPTPVPLPATLWLLASGLGLMALPCFRRRRSVA